MTRHISEEKIERVKGIIQKLQEASPFIAVTKKSVYDRINANEMTYRTLGRAFRRLVERGSLIQEVRGQYWLPEFHAKSIRNLKRIGDFESIKEVTIHILDALRYCESEEDWKLLEAFFTKMRENKYERDRAEFEEADQKLRSQVLEELERERKSSDV